MVARHARMLKATAQYLSAEAVQRRVGCGVYVGDGVLLPAEVVECRGGTVYGRIGDQVEHAAYAACGWGYTPTRTWDERGSLYHYGVRNGADGRFLSVSL